MKLKNKQICRLKYEVDLLAPAYWRSKKIKFESGSASSNFRIAGEAENRKLCLSTKGKEIPKENLGCPLEGHG